MLGLLLLMSTVCGYVIGMLIGFHHGSTYNAPIPRGRMGWNPPAKGPMPEPPPAPPRRVVYYDVHVNSERASRWYE